jgi:hypothetical protein
MPRAPIVVGGLCGGLGLARRVGRGFIGEVFVVSGIVVSGIRVGVPGCVGILIVVNISIVNIGIVSISIVNIGGCVGVVSRIAVLAVGAILVVGPRGCRGSRLVGRIGGTAQRGGRHRIGIRRPPRG